MPELNQVEIEKKISELLNQIDYQFLEFTKLLTRLNEEKNEYLLEELRNISNYYVFLVNQLNQKLEEAKVTNTSLEKRIKSYNENKIANLVYVSQNTQHYERVIFKEISKVILEKLNAIKGNFACLNTKSFPNELQNPLQNSIDQAKKLINLYKSSAEFQEQIITFSTYLSYFERAFNNLKAVSDSAQLIMVSLSTIEKHRNLLYIQQKIFNFYTDFISTLYLSLNRETPKEAKNKSRKESVRTSGEYRPDFNIDSKSKLDEYLNEFIAIAKSNLKSAIQAFQEDPIESEALINVLNIINTLFPDKLNDLELTPEPKSNKEECGPPLENPIPNKLSVKFLKIFNIVTDSKDTKACLSNFFSPKLNQPSVFSRMFLSPYSKTNHSYNLNKTKNDIYQIMENTKLSFAQQIIKIERLINARKPGAWRFGVNQERSDYNKLLEQSRLACAYLALHSGKIGSVQFLTILNIASRNSSEPLKVKIDAFITSYKQELEKCELVQPSSNNLGTYVNRLRDLLPKQDAQSISKHITPFLPTKEAERKFEFENVAALSETLAEVTTTNIKSMLNR